MENNEVPVLRLSEAEGRRVELKGRAVYLRLSTENDSALDVEILADEIDGLIHALLMAKADMKQRSAGMESVRNPASNPLVYASVIEGIMESRTSQDGEEVNFRLRASQGPDLLVTMGINELIRLTAQLHTLQLRATPGTNAFTHDKVVLSISHAALLTDEGTTSVGLSLFTTDGVNYIIPLGREMVERIAAKSAEAKQMYSTHRGREN